MNAVVKLESASLVRYEAMRRRSAPYSMAGQKNLIRRGYPNPIQSPETKNGPEGPFLKNT